MKNWVSFFSLILTTVSTCVNIPEILIPINPRLSCGFPLQASVAYLTGSTPIQDACIMYLASHRFDRFREWLNSMGGYANPKISFHRGHFVDPVSGKPRFGHGGVFLNANEYLSPGELLFSVPEQATFGEAMVARYFPTFPRFLLMYSDKLWLAIGLAGLLKHHPKVVGPWQALLPDMRYHPIFWPDADMNEFRNSQAFKIITVSREMVDTGCQLTANHMQQMDLTCDDVKEAYAILTSRAFGMGRLAGTNEPSSAIPFGPDLLNHSPHSASWISRVVHGPQSHPDKVETVFYLVGYVLSESRELFNNYGKHALPGALATYGFTQPDNKDELVIVATTDADFEGKRFEHTAFTKSFCPSKLGVKDLFSSPLTCTAKYPPMQQGIFDTAGYFRLTEKDAILLGHEDAEIECSTPVNGIAWKHVKHELKKRQVDLDAIQFTVPLNVMNGAEPLLPFRVAIWMALCAIPNHAPVAWLDQFVQSASTCEIERNKYYLEDFPLGKLVKSLSRLALFNTCAFHETETLGGLATSLRLWIAYRNLRVQLQHSVFDSKDISHILSFSSNTAFVRFLAFVVERKDRVFSDSGGMIDRATETAARMPAHRIERLEEIHRYKMQSAYMVMMKCRQPLESVVTMSGVNTNFNS